MPDMIVQSSEKGELEFKQSKKVVHCSKSHEAAVTFQRLSSNVAGYVFSGTLGQNMATKNVADTFMQTFQLKKKKLVISEESIPWMMWVAKSRYDIALLNPQVSKKLSLSQEMIAGMLMDNPNNEPPLSDKHAQHYAIIQAERAEALKEIAKEERMRKVSPLFLMDLSLKKNPDGSRKYPNMICYHDLQQSFGHDHFPVFFVNEHTIYLVFYIRQHPEISVDKALLAKSEPLSQLAYREYYYFLKQFERYPAPETDLETAQKVFASLKEPANVILNKYDFRSYVGRILFSEEFKPFLPEQSFSNPEVDDMFRKEDFLNSFFDEFATEDQDFFQKPLHEVFDAIFVRLQQRLNQNVENDEEESKYDDSPNIQKFKSFLQAACNSESEPDFSIFDSKIKDPNQAYYVRLLQETYQLSETRKGTAKYSKEDKKPHQEIKKYVDNSINNVKQRMEYDANENDIKRFFKNVLDSDEFKQVNSVGPKLGRKLQQSDSHWTQGWNFDSEIEEAISPESMSEDVRRAPHKLLYCIFQRLNPHVFPKNGEPTIAMYLIGFEPVYNRDRKIASTKEIKQAQFQLVQNCTEYCLKHFPNRELDVNVIGCDQDYDILEHIERYILELNCRIRATLYLANRNDEVNYRLPKKGELQAMIRTFSNAGENDFDGCEKELDALMQMIAQARQHAEKQKQLKNQKKESHGQVKSITNIHRLIMNKPPQIKLFDSSPRAIALQPNENTTTVKKTVSPSAGFSRSQT